jgi:adenosylcobinamide-phosphate synthase
VTAVALLLGLLIDHFVGEAKRWHPLVGFGNAASTLEKAANPSSGTHGKLRGLACWALMVFIPVMAMILAVSQLSGLALLVVNALVVYLVVGLKSLAEHGRNVAVPLLAGDLSAARQQIAMMVSRDTDKLTEQQVASATCESVLENGSDAIFAALFWFCLLGAPGAILYRGANTLDAMWGYKTDRYLRFGWAAARIDDFLNWLPARLTALSYGLMGNFSSALKCARQQGGLTDSPNAGYVMAAGAGALGTSMGGVAIYQGEEHQRPIFGLGPVAEAIDIERAIALVQRTSVLWILLALAFHVLTVLGPSL